MTLATQPQDEPSAIRFSLGVGLTNACNLSCDHCYRATGTDELSAAQVLAATDAVPTRAVNFGTGENGLHPEFSSLIEALADRGIKVTMTTNGHSAEVLSDEVLSRLRDVEFSIDYPDEGTHDGARGAGNWALIEEQMARCQKLGVGTTIVSVLMAANHRAMGGLAALAKGRGALLRVNIYQSVRTDAFTLSYKQFWWGMGELLGAGELVACGEPIVRAMLGIPRAPGAGCGVETVRITPRGKVVPCVYGADAELDLDDLARLGPGMVEHPTFTGLRQVPSACSGCPHVDTCHGGCASRRALRGSLDGADPYCPILRGKALPKLDVRLAEHSAEGPPPKASSACTTIIRPL